MACSPLGAQSVSGSFSSSAGPNGAMSGVMHMSPRRFAGVPVTGAPYSAQRVTEHVQVGADGTRFTRSNQQETLYRDSQGRTRTERPMMMAPLNAPDRATDAPLLVEITDPVANVGYTLDTQNKVAHRYTLEATPQHPAAMPPSVAAGGGRGVALAGVMTTTASAGPGHNAQPRPETRQEDLGAQIIEGVPAKGRRFVQTWPAGSQGNDRAFETTSENWFAEDLRMPILSRSVDPRSGENTVKLINITRIEPAANLFVPPPEYSIVDENGPFEIRWTGQRQ